MPSLNISFLQTFLMVVQTGNLNKAAERLNVTPSTVTTRLSLLEEAVGQKLLLRSRSGAELTRAGFTLQRHAELMVRTWDIARRTAGLPKGYSGLFGFGCYHDFWDDLGASLVDHIRSDHPDLALEAWPGDVDSIQRWLSNGLVDVALVPEALSSQGLMSDEILQDRIVQVATVRRTAKRWDSGYIYVDHGAAFRRQHAAAWPTQETAHITFGSSRWALDYLLDRGGSAYLPWRIAEKLVDQRRLFIVEGSPEFIRHVHLVRRDVSTQLYEWLDTIQDCL